MTSSTDAPKLPCPRCGSSESRVVDNYSLYLTPTIARRRQCVTCAYRFTTCETYHPKYQPSPLVGDTDS